MKNFMKIIASAIAGVIASMALVTTVGAADYYDTDGTIWTDNIRDGKVYVEDNYGRYNDSYYVGYDVFLEDIYVTNTGYYAINGNGTTYLGKNFVFTEYIGTDRYGKEIYYRSECGYMYFSNNTWCTVGYNINNVSW